MPQLAYAHNSLNGQTVHPFVALSSSAVVQPDPALWIDGDHSVANVDTQMGPQSGQGDSCNRHPLLHSCRRDLRLALQHELQQYSGCAKTFMQ